LRLCFCIPLTNCCTAFVLAAAFMLGMCIGGGPPPLNPAPGRSNLRSD
jgi:hypothetical protein